MLKKAFHHRFEGIIWKLRPDETAGYLVLEIRNTEKKEASFSCIRFRSGRLAFSGLKLQEPWFCGLDEAAHGHAFLHGYLSETLPGHRGIFARRLETGETSWDDYNLVFSHAAARGIVAWNYKSEPRRYQLTDPETGKAVQSFNSPEDAAQAAPDLKRPEILLPVRSEIDDGWRQHLPEDALPGFDLLRVGVLHIAAFYTPAGDKMDHHLWVLDEQMRPLHKDLLARGILHPALDTFFVMSGQLCYVKSKSEILAYFL